MQIVWTPLMAVLLCSTIQLLPQAVADRRIMQGSAARPARFSRYSSNTIGKAGMHGAIADLVNFFGLEQTPASVKPEAGQKVAEGQASTPHSRIWKWMQFGCQRGCSGLILRPTKSLVVARR